MLFVLPSLVICIQCWNYTILSGNSASLFSASWRPLPEDSSQPHEVLWHHAHSTDPQPILQRHGWRYHLFEWMHCVENAQVLTLSHVLAMHDCNARRWNMFKVSPRSSHLSGHAAAVPGGDVHPERHPGGVLPRCDQQRLPMVPGSCGPIGAPLHFVAHRLSGLHTWTQTSRQHHTVPVPLPHRLQHPGPEHSAGLRQGGRVPPQVSLSLKLLRYYQSLLIYS